MFLIYFYSTLAVILMMYMVIEKKRFLTYKIVNQLKYQEEYSAEMAISIQKNFQSTPTECSV